MSVGSSVGLAWAVQVETMPLILASKSHSSYKLARTFFSLLALRARSFTLSFSPSHRSKTNVGSIPTEISDLILDQLFSILVAVARQRVVDDLGLCYNFEQHSDELEKDHVCGIDCSSWTGCCSLKEDAEDDGDGFWEREGSFRERLGNGYGVEINIALSTYHLRLISVPSAFPCKDFPSGLPRTVLGIPYLPPSFEIKSNASLREVKVSELEPTEENDEIVEVVPLGLPTITKEERQRFAKARKGLRFEFGEADGAFAKKKLREGGKEKRDGDEEMEGDEQEEDEEGEIGEEVERLMIVHKGWCTY
ncbi:hypothetical protein BDY24DRAFT_382118 [Mrakia frigida]|uniref:uncharacterized protein n=1 Tax=Mrakia frigida TaxID=29902 RepID=UPI003FCBF5E4